MVRFDIISIFPDMFQAITQFGITRRAVEQQLIQLHIWNPRDYSADSHQRVDERPYGGGPGMVMQVAPVRAAIQAAKKAAAQKPLCVYLSPQGKPVQQSDFVQLAQNPEQRLILLCGRYEGIDQRLIEADIDEEWSVGDYVLSGGELAAMMAIDALTRLLPGSLGDAESAKQDSFMQGLLDCPHYTRPPVIDGQSVPEVLQNGDHQAIARWRLKQQLWRTYCQRPDLLQKYPLTPELQELLSETLQEYEKLV